MKKILLLTCLLTLCAVFGVKANDTWPITLTKADGLPGNLSVTGSCYTYKSPLYSFDEAVTTLRITVCETNTSELGVNGFNGRASWGPGWVYFSLGELRIFDETGEEVTYTPTSNATAPGDGSLEGLYDKDPTTHFHTVYGRGELDQGYHYIELQIERDDLYSFRFEWDTRNNYHLNQPTYIGLTPGTEYLPLPEQNLQVEKITSLEELSEEGALFVLEGHSPDWEDKDRERTNIGGGFFEAPCVGTKTPSPLGVFSLVPVDGKDNTYKVHYLNYDRWIVKQTNVGSGFVEWTNLEKNAAELTFAPSKDVEGDFVITTLDESIIYSQDAIVRMAYIANTDSALQAQAEVRPYALNFSMYKAAITGKTIAYQLEEVIAEAESRMEAYGEMVDYIEENEYETLQEAVTAGKAILASGDAMSASDVLKSKDDIVTKLADYAAFHIYLWVDSISAIMDAMSDGEILTSTAPNWINNSYPEDADVALQAAIDAGDIAVETYKNLYDVDQAIAAIKKAIDDFWASKISNVKSLPFRVGKDSDGLPGVMQSNGSFKWESPVYYLTEEVDQLRFTVFDTNNSAKLNQTVFPTLGEFELYTITGEKIELTEDCFTTNSVAPNDGKGLAGLCDNDINSHYHAAWTATQDPYGFDGSTYVYIEVTLPEAITGFKYIQYGRKNGVNTPTDFVFGYTGEDVTPLTVAFPDEFNAELGAQIKDISEINDNEIYAIEGLINCDPVNGKGADGCFYSSYNRWTDGPFQSPCAFTIRSTGDNDGTYYIQSLADGTYWKSIRSNAPDYWNAGTSTIYKSQAAKVKIEPNNNEGLPYSFVIYEYIDESYRDVDSLTNVHCPYVIAQDWGDGLGWFNVPSLDRNDKDGEGEWYIYRMSMDTPYSYWLGNLTSTAVSLGLVESDDPGYYKDLGDFPEIVAGAHAVADAKDDAASKDYIAKLETALSSLENIETNPVVAGIYVIEANNPAFYQKQSKKKAMYFMESHACGDYCGDIEIGWTNSPADIMEADSVYLMQLIPAASDDEFVAAWLADSLITDDQVKDAYYIKNLKFGTYIAHPDKENLLSLGYTSMRSKHVFASETPAPFMVLQRDGASFDIWMPGEGIEAGDAGNLTLHLQDHNGGDGVGGHLVMWNRGDANSQWNLRLVSDLTSIDDIVIENGDELISKTYYTIDGVASSTPVKGVNIVKYVYSNGVVKSKKIFVE